MGFISPAEGCDDSVPIGIRVVGEGDIVAVLEADEPRHRIGTGAVHADLAVVIDRHEREGRIDLRVHHSDIQVIDRVDRFPVMHGGATERIDGELEAGGANGLHIDNVAQIGHVGQDEVLLVRRLGAEGRSKAHPFHTSITVAQQVVGPVLDPPGHVDIGRTSVSRIVLEPTVLRRVV